MSVKAFAIFGLCVLWGSQATACTYIVQVQLSFEGGSADLQRSQIVKLSNWIDRARTVFPTYKSATVEVGASGADRKETSALAEQRLRNTLRALRTLWGAHLPVETDARS